MNISTTSFSAVRSLGTALRRGLAVAAGVAACSVASSQIVDPFFAGSYSVTSLGSVGGVPAYYGGITFLNGDLNTLLIGGSANNALGTIYSVGVVRDVNNHITGFTGPASFYADAPFIDGGLTYAPNGTLFYTGYPNNTLGQILPGSTAPDSITDLSLLGVSGSVGSFAFVPGTHPGAGQAKAVTYSGGGNWYTLGMSLNLDGTYSISSASYAASLDGGPEGIAYVPIGSPLFSNPSVLVAEWAWGRVSVYEVDANGDPITSTQKVFLSSLSGAEGALIDPLTGDFLFSTFGGGDQVVRVSGFALPPPPPPPGGNVPDGASTGVLLLGVLGTAIALRRRMT